MKETFAIDLKNMVDSCHLLFLLCRESRFAARYNCSCPWTPFDKPPTGFSMKASRGLSLSGFAVVAVPDLWVQMFGLLMLFVLTFPEGGCYQNRKLPNFEGNQAC